jgi:hypothetical protein
MAMKQSMGAQIFPKSMGNLKIIDVRKLAWSNFHTEKPLVWVTSTIIQNLVIQATWYPGYVHPWSIGQCRNFVLMTDTDQHSTKLQKIIFHKWNILYAGITWNFQHYELRVHPLAVPLQAFKFTLLTFSLVMVVKFWLTTKFSSMHWHELLFLFQVYDSLGISAYVKPLSSIINDKQWLPMPVTPGCK